MSNSMVHEIPVADIVVGKRYRKEMGEMDKLAKSIDELGLLQPIAVDCENHLLFGERRLRAVRDILKRPTIEAVILDVDMLQAEYAENEIRKDFTALERLAIAEAFLERMGKRQGQKNQKTPEKPSEKQQGSHVENSPHVNTDSKSSNIEPGEKTREAAAKAAGFGSDHTMRQAQKVAEQGVPELVEAMDKKEISINAAANAVALPPESQKKVVEQIKKGKKPKKAIEEEKAAVEQAKQQETATPPPVPQLVDPAGLVIPVSLESVFKSTDEFDRMEKLLKQLQKDIHELAETPGGEVLRTQLSHKGSSQEKIRHSSAHVTNAISLVKSSRPYASCCPMCHWNEQISTECRHCLGLGWVTKAVWEAAPSDYREQVIRDKSTKESKS